jgi:CheY-like chemotaxis protein
MARVLVVDDEPALRYFQRIVLDEHGLDVEEAGDGASALRRCSDEPDAYSMIVLDYRMPGMTGIEVAQQLRHDGDTTPIVLYSGYLDPAVADQAGALGLTMVDKSDTERLVSLVTARAA